MKEKLSDYTKKELIKILESASGGPEDSKRLAISKVSKFETFEELWSHVNKDYHKSVYYGGKVVEVLKTGKHWFTKHRYIDVDIPSLEFYPVYWCAAPGEHPGKFRITKENFETMVITLYYYKVITIKLTQPKEEKDD